MNLARAFELLRALDLPSEDYAVFGSGPLLVRGIINSVRDIDIIARGAAWDKALASGELRPLPEHGLSVAAFFDDAVTVGTSWGIGDVDVNSLIDSAELFDGTPFVRLEHVIAYKEIAGRPKDHEHLRSVAEWLRSRPHPAN